MSTAVLEHIKGDRLTEAVSALHLNPNEDFSVIVISENEKNLGYTEDGVAIVEDDEMVAAMNHYRKSLDSEKKMDAKTFLKKIDEEETI